MMGAEQLEPFMFTYHTKIVLVAAMSLDGRSVGLINYQSNQGYVISSICTAPSRGSWKRTI